MAESDRWTKLGEQNPYFAVCTEPRMRRERMTVETRREFFASGERDVAETLELIRGAVAPAFRPRSALDFGCGVGRLTLPLAALCDSVLGVDVSQPMIREAARNGEERGIQNARFALAGSLETETAARFDFVHSYIVFQHVPPREGLRLTRLLLRLLAPGGVAALHYTYARRATILRRVVNRVRRGVRPVDVVLRWMQGLPPFEPGIPMYNYDVGALLTLFREHGAATIHAHPTDHGGFLGVMLVARKPAAGK